MHGLIQYQDYLLVRPDQKTFSNSETMIYLIEKPQFTGRMQDSVK